MHILLSCPLLKYLESHPPLDQLQIMYDQGAKTQMGQNKFIVEFSSYGEQKEVMKKFPHMKKYIKQWHRVK